MLILSLWATATLAAVGIAQATRVSLELKWFQRLEESRQAWYLALSGIEAASSLLSADDPAFDALQEKWGTFPKDPIPFGSGTFDWTIADEQSRIPINTASLELLTQLPGFSPSSALEVLSRRGQGKLVSHLAELLALEGFRKEEINQLESLVTVHAKGLVNLNTAKEEVMARLGLSPALANQIARYRLGSDGILGSSDDGVFTDLEEIQTKLEEAFGPLLPEDQMALANLISSQRIGVRSSFFRIESEGVSLRHGITKKVAGIVERSDPNTSLAIRGWHESR